MRRALISCGLWLGVLIIQAGSAQAQPGRYNHPELDWFTLKTDHFQVHYHSGAERTAQEIARIAESIHGPVTRMYDYDQEKIFHIVVKDHDDYSNGIAYFYDNKMEIWATPMDFELRGTHPWLLNVVTHEFTHMVSMDQAKRFGKHVPALYFQYIGYEIERRPDVLYGFPNRIVSFPIAGAAVPPWFAEGIAQYQTAETAYDYWDTHRDMILRSAVLANQLPSYRDMSAFGHTSLGNEQVYNSGFAFVIYLADKYGPETLHRMIRETRSPLKLTFEAAGKNNFGITVSQAYEDWKAYLEGSYQAQMQDILSREMTGKIIQEKGFGNFYPTWSPRGDKVAYISNQGQESFSASALMLYDLATQKNDVIKAQVQYAPTFSPTADEIAYVKRHRYNRFGSTYYELYTQNLKDKKEVRLTHGGRLRNPSWSPDGDAILCTTGRDGTDNLVLVDPVNGAIKALTAFDQGEQVFRASWAPDGARIVFDVARGHGRDIAQMNRDGSGFQYLVQDDHDARSPVYGAGGETVFYSSDQSGVFNIYTLDLASGSSKPVTNVSGGAFMPSLHPLSGLVYSLYTVDGYKIAHIESPKAIDRSIKVVAGPTFKRSRPVVDISQARNGHNGTATAPSQDRPASPYKSAYGVVNLLPRAVIDYGTLKLGTYFTSSEMLDRFSVLGGFAVNRRYDLDVFGILEYRHFYPTIFLEIYNQIRHEEDGADKFKFNLLEADLGLELKFNPTHTFRTMYVYSRYDGKITNTDQGIKVGYSYFLGSDFAFLWRYDNVARTSTAVINPRAGRRISLRYDRQHNRFINGFEINSKFGTLQETYQTYDYNQITVDWDEYFSLPWRHGLQLRTRVGYIDREIDSFFNFFAGGLPGLKGYPYYSIEGRKMAMGSVTYRFKISDRLGLFLPPLKFDKLYGGIFFEYGNAWDDGGLEPGDFKKDVGLQLRMDVFAFYNFPMRVFFDAAYGLDDVSNRGFGYGKEWRYYFGLTFDYID